MASAARGAVSDPTGPGCFELACPAPFDWDWMLGFLGRRLIAGVEHIEDATYRRVLRLPQGSGWAIGWLSARWLPGRQAIAVELDAGLLPVAGLALAALRRVFDLDARPLVINAVLGELAADAPGLRVPGTVDGFELAVRAVLGQQVTVKAAHTLAGRLAARFGHPLASESSVAPPGAPRAPGPAGPRGAPGAPATADPPALAIPACPGIAFPDAVTMAALTPDDLRECGLIRTRAAAILAIAHAVAHDGLVLEAGAPVEPAMRHLRSLRGVGDWTAQYVAMRALACPDAFPAADLVLMRVLDARTPAQAAARAQVWRPWRSYSVMHLWRRAALAASAS
jgi:AraC family transcriptional regulator of adaptative response / DNA-3-methyladenine glycosylase II